MEKSDEEKVVEAATKGGKCVDESDEEFHDAADGNDDVHE